MNEKKLTHVDVLEEMMVVFESIETDIADMVWFSEKPHLLECATVLRENAQRIIVGNRAYRVDGRTTTNQLHPDELPF
jgi:hypothetical protein